MSGSDQQLKIITTGVTEEKHEFLWKIENFMRIHNDETLREPQKFEIETGSKSSLKTKWVLGLKNRPDMPYYHVYANLVEVSSPTEIGPLPCSLSVQLLRKSDKSVYWDAQCQGRLGVGEGFDLDDQYWWRAETKFENFLDPDGALWLKIKLSLLKPFPDNRNEGKDVEERFHRNSLRIVKRNLAFLMESVEATVKIACSDGKEVKCHEQILKGNSPVFSTMLKSGLSETKSGTVNVEDISGDAMEVIINYLCTGELLPKWSDPNIIVEFTYAAAKYQLVELLEYLDDKLGNTSYDDNDEGDSFVLPALLDLTKKLSLKKAEDRLKQEIVKRINSAESTDDILSLFRGGRTALDRFPTEENKLFENQNV